MYHSNRCVSEERLFTKQPVLMTYAQQRACTALTVELEPYGSRAAAALRLQRYDVAAADAQHAAERDPACCRALLRGARAQLGLRQPAEAARLFEEVLRRIPGNRAAQV